MWRCLTLFSILSFLLSQFALAQVPQRQPPGVGGNRLGQTAITPDSSSAPVGTAQVPAPVKKIPTEELESLTNKLIDDFLIEFKDKPFFASDDLLEIADTSQASDPILKLKKLRILALLMSREVLEDRFRAGLVGLEPVLQVETRITKSALAMPLSKKQRLQVLLAARNKAITLAAVIREKRNLGVRGGEADAAALATAALLDAEIAYQEELLAQK